MPLIDTNGRPLASEAETKAREERAAIVRDSVLAMLGELKPSHIELVEITINMLGITLAATSWPHFGGVVEYLAGALGATADRVAMAKRAEAKIAAQLDAANRQGSPT